MESYNISHPLQEQAITRGLRGVTRHNKLPETYDRQYFTRNKNNPLEIKTIMLIADAPLTYGSYNSKMYPIIPDGEKTVTHGTRGKDKINAIKIYEKILEILN